MNLGCFQEFEFTENRNKICAMIAGAAFTSGWWFAIDASATDPENTNDLYHLCGVFGFLSMLMVNAVSNGQLRGEAYTDGLLGGFAAKVWFFLGLLMGFGSVMGAFVILIEEYLNSEKYTSVVPGVQFVVQNICILSGSLIYRFGRSEDMWG